VARSLHHSRREALTVADAVATNFLCHLGILQELRSDQGCNLESRLLHEVLQCLGVSKTYIMPLQPQSDNTVEHYIKTVEEHLRKVVASLQKD
jgi:hypothetical protein